jgi:hypothetical protein
VAVFSLSLKTKIGYSEFNNGQANAKNIQTSQHLGGIDLMTCDEAFDKGVEVPHGENGVKVLERDHATHLTSPPRFELSRNP